MALICIDFDDTIASGHVHNSISRNPEVAGYTPFDPNFTKNQAFEDAQWEIAKAIGPAGDANKWKNSIENLIREGHSVAITSYTKYPHMIERYLREVIKIDPALMSQIKVVGDYPKINYPNIKPGTPSSDPGNLNADDDIGNMKVIGKSQHMEVALEHFKSLGKTFEKKDVFLIDDSPDNVRVANENEYNGIQAGKGFPANANIIEATKANPQYASQFSAVNNAYEHIGTIPPPAQRPAAEQPHMGRLPPKPGRDEPGSLYQDFSSLILQEKSPQQAEPYMGQLPPINYTSTKEVKKARNDIIKELITDVSRDKKLTSPEKHEIKKMISALKDGLRGRHNSLEKAQITPEQIAQFKEACKLAANLIQPLVTAKKSGHDEAIHARHDVYEKIKSFQNSNTAQMKAQISGELQTAVKYMQFHIRHADPFDLKSKIIVGNARKISSKEQPFIAEVAKLWTTPVLRGDPHKAHADPAKQKYSNFFKPNEPQQKSDAHNKSGPPKFKR